MYMYVIILCAEAVMQETFKVLLGSKRYSRSKAKSTGRLKTSPSLRGCRDVTLIPSNISNIVRRWQNSPASLNSISWDFTCLKSPHVTKTNWARLLSPMKTRDYALTVGMTWYVRMKCSATFNPKNVSERIVGLAFQAKYICLLWSQSS